MEPVEVDEDLLRDVLGLLGIGQHAVGDTGDAGVFGFEERLERALLGLHGGHMPCPVRCHLGAH